MAGRSWQGCALVSDQPRPALAGKPLARHRLARPWQDPPGKGFAAFEAWRDEMLEKEEVERHKLGRKIARRKTGCAMACRAGANATRGGWTVACAAHRAPGAAEQRHGEDGSGGGRAGGLDGKGGWVSPMAIERSFAIFPCVSIAVTASALSVPMGRARPRCSSCSPATRATKRQCEAGHHFDGALDQKRANSTRH